MNNERGCKVCSRLGARSLNLWDTPGSRTCQRCAEMIMAWEKENLGRVNDGWETPVTQEYATKALNPWSVI